MPKPSSKHLLPRLLAGAALLFIAAQAHAETLNGRVSSAAGGDVLQGAVVRVQETGRETITGRDGSFAFNDLAPGDYVLVVTYAGFDPQEVRVSLAPQTNPFQDIQLSAAALETGEILVTARRTGQAQAINLQRIAPSVRTVVSADALGQIREGNIGDALVRLPGVSVETRAGVQRTATIRGLAPQYNTVTVDGIRMTNVDGNRDIALDTFPFNMLARVEVVKAPTPDLTADAIGGTVDLITRSAFDTRGPLIEGQVGGTYNDLRRNWNYQAGLTVAGRFGADGQFGALASVYYFHDVRGYDTVETGYTIGANGVAAINRAFYYDRAETKDRVNAGLSLDWRPDADTSVYARGLYSYDFRELNQRGTDYRPNVATQTGVTPDGGSSTGARIDLISFYREPKNVFQMYTLGARHGAGDWEFNARGIYSKAEKTYPTTLQITNSINGVNLAYDRTERDFPSFAVTNGINTSDPSRVAFRQFDTNQVPRVEDEWTADASVRRSFDIGDAPTTLQLGGRASWKDASQAQPLTVRYTGLTGQSIPGLLQTYTNDRFMRASDGRAVLLPFFPDHEKYLALQQSNPAAFTQTPAARLFTGQTIANADFSISENIYAGYAMGTITLDQLNIIAGVRAEKTEVGSRALRVVTSGNTVTTSPVSASNSYTNVLPSLNARYTALDDRLVLRGAISKAISRPPPGDLVASRQENAQANQRVIGNPDLRPARSLNLDATAEYFFPPLGVLSAGLFYKDIKDFVFSSSRIAEDGVDERTRVNGGGGKVKGAEFAWVQQFTFLPGALSGLGVEANFTYLDSDASYPGRAENLPLVNSPSYVANAILVYTRGPFDVRLSYNSLPKRLEAVGATAADDGYYAPIDTLDFAMKVKLFGANSLFLNIKNLTDVPTVLYQRDPGTPKSVTYYGTQYNFGLNFKF